jgi:hypothetical protein
VHQDVNCTWPLDTVITSINLPIVSIISRLAQLNKTIVDDMFDLLDLRDTGVLYCLTKATSHTHTEPLFAQHTAAEWLWGYEDRLLSNITKYIDDVLHVSLTAPVVAFLTNNSALFYESYSSVQTGGVCGLILLLFC